MKLHATGQPMTESWILLQQEFFRKVLQGEITKNRLQEFLCRSVISDRDDYPTFAQIKELFSQIANGRVLESKFEKFIRKEVGPIETGIKTFEKIDCDNVFIPYDYWTVEEHQKTQFNFSASIKLYLSEKQKNGSIFGYELRKELEGMSVLNSCHLDYLLAHSELIPNGWKRKAVFFLGTVYKFNEALYVRCIIWDGYKWSWICISLGTDFSFDYPVALAR